MKTSGIGGQAVLEGVMMRHKNDVAVAVRKSDGTIQVGRQKVTSPKDKCKIFGWPIIRGVVSFVASLVIGIKTLTYSASILEDEIEEQEAREKAEKEGSEAADKKKSGKKDADKKEGGESAMMVGTVLFSVVLAVGIFIILPYFAATGILKLFGSDSNILLAVIEGVLKLAIFIGYMAAISLMKDIRRTFMYHGAEHKCINCVEAGLPLTVDNAMKSSKEHRRCGTSFIFIVLIISIIFFVFIQMDNRLLRFLLRLVLVPVIAGISFEFIQWAGNSDSKVAAILSRPGMWVQGLSTKEPTPDMVEVAICSVDAVFSWRDYFKERGFEVPEETEAASKEPIAETTENDLECEAAEKNGSENAGGQVAEATEQQ